MNHDIIADVFSAIKNMENIGRTTAEVPASTLTTNILSIMKNHEYIGETTPVKRGRRLQVELKGRINDCNVIKPRFSVKNQEFIKWEKRFLPANNLGILILSTSRGLMDHHTAKKEGLGGQLLGFVY